MHINEALDECAMCYFEASTNTHALLNLLNKLRLREKCESYRVFYRFFATSLINQVVHEHECFLYFSYDR